ncbi:hypothetical protein SAMN05216576_107208 [Ectopseudomonas chengduensis]|uniref:Uncharacterized protein n=1 Tax=Ectopseudomonas chengduensis TaxID=489632 RepID=A0A1G6Q1F9_9GAMM|nr:MULTISPECIES: hypothetical protein [Pseudomonas]MBP3062035.1 hypothetical protein [Pseudomonas chengduensis]OEO24426.1 hypothetical protein AX279_17305 [Pseudomonas sp. J237]SDC86280.1 hypothetical protein SAMN05216576_107208 [Pseudomonas chengduensis]
MTRQKDDDIYYDPKLFRGGRGIATPAGSQPVLRKKRLQGSRSRGLFAIVMAMMMGAVMFMLWQSGHKMLVLALQPPPSGTITLYGGFATRARTVPLGVIGQGSRKHCRVSLVSGQQAQVLDVVVRAGRNETVHVPVGNYRASIECGKLWYGSQPILSSAVAIDLGPFTDSNEAGLMMGHVIRLNAPGS